MTEIFPVIMAGGTGTRLWPLSRRAHPKQFQPLLSEKSMLAETTDRLTAIDGIQLADPMVICGAAHESLVRDCFDGETRKLGRMVLEPEGRNTAPVAIIAASLAAEENEDALVLLLPADHHIADPAAFGDAVRKAAAAAEQGYLTTFGIAPSHPETGYGYILRGEPLSVGAYTVEQFVEKPDRETAEAYLKDDRYSWNAGIFLFPARLLLKEAEAHAPEILRASIDALRASMRTTDKIALDAEAFAAVPGDSIDYAIMERTDRAAVIGPVSMGWNDIGSWHAVRELKGATEGHNAADNAIVSNCHNTLVHSDGPLVAAIGLENVVIIATGDAVLVVDADHAQEVKGVIDTLKAAGRDDLL
ncbi:mannose-1-phosphate guanylyltransferase/mannose-6-phosphate isomerase [Parvularcula marina]|uniref:mannose-1-phosphate guanylyltransferase n=1 Tax=Parvularcula marina TaxID=2292771 RepID=A0A371RHH2_9PROT|nr:mannose-1-phosphate guanylyltransferase/mannose-6-phosphate isomerase [Parvularcula marina]RFB04899.1 mannose-1-phosphate guanylyltransferase/mannose-6-phosphate isomerase [Parvularcula marina]